MRNEQLTPEEDETEILERIKSEVFRKYDSDDAKTRISAEEINLGKRHVEAVTHLIDKFCTTILKVSPKDHFLAMVAGYLHDVEKYNPKPDTEHRDLARAQLLEHAQDSEQWAGHFLTKLGWPEEDIKTVRNAILRHQPMPYPEAALKLELERENSQIVTRLETQDPNIKARGKFKGPNDQVSAIVFAADLLALGKLWSENPEYPQAGAFDKIVAVELKEKSLPEAIASAAKSLGENLTALENMASRGIDELFYLAKINQMTHQEILGYKTATAICLQIIEAYKPGMQRILKEVEKLSQNSELTGVTTMAPYYKKVAKIQAAI